MARLPLPPAEPLKLVHLAEIAKGGMGSVQMARIEGGRLHGQVVALKRLNPNVAQDPQFVGMFLDEAWMTAALRSPNVISAIAWGNDHDGMFLAVELVQGVSLSRLMKESREHGESFAERTAAFIGSQICSGLSAAHDLRGPDGGLLGLVHRDLTPGNILVSFDGIVKIADFGIAKAEERITHTQTGTLKGKPAYMAPEQARGGKVDGRADIFSFGVMFFELLAGRKPWTSKSAFDVMMEAATAPTPDLGELRKGLNKVFIDIVNRCLAKKATERFSTAGEIQALLDGWRSSKGFAPDDMASLAGFVRRNSTKQIAWYEQAMRGDFARGEGPTIKEIEEKLDESREKKPPPKPRPAAGRSDLDPMQPAAAIRPAAGAPPPSSGRVLAAIPAPPPSQRVLPAAKGPPRKGLSGTERMSDEARAQGFALASGKVSTRTPPSDPNRPQGSPNLGGTMLMDESPVASPRSPSAPGASGQSGGRALDLPPRRRESDGLPLPPKRLDSNPSPVDVPSSGARPPYGGRAAPYQGAPGAAPYSPPNAAPPIGGGYPGAASAAGPAPQAAPYPMPAQPPAAPWPPAGASTTQSPPARGGAGKLLLLLAIPLIAAGGLAAWMLRDRLVPRPAPTPTVASATTPVAPSLAPSASGTESAPSSSSRPRPADAGAKD